VEAGFESIAQIPIRFQNQVIGSIHLADQRTGRFGAEVAEFIETVAPLVGEALHRFEVEENLRESEERFRSMFESHAAVMLLIDPESGTIVDANPPAERLYGHSRSQLCSMKIEDLNIATPAMSATGSRAGGGRAGSLVMRHRRADGSVRTVEVHSSPVQVAGRHLLFSIAHDITERKHLEKRILEIGDGERQRIGQDLHDSLGGHLTGLALMGKGLARALAKKNLEESAFAEEIAQGVNDAVIQTRAIARGLCPVGLGKLGLASSLEEYAGNQSRMLRVDCRVETRGQVVIRDESVAAHLFRIVQEAVTNAVRHGKARRIRIQLRQRKGVLSLRVQDNGRGLPAKVAKGRGLGLPTMRYRAEVLGAQLEITSKRGKGTLISCRVPMQTRKQT
jgi:PAS domain S-box-containing protein